MKRLAAIIVLLLALAACGGDSPTAPSFRQLVFTETIGTDGRAFIDLPREAGTITNPPSMTCYMSDDGDTWLVIGTDLDGSSCGLSENSDGTLYAAIIGAPSGYLFRVVVVFED